jgi:hypothetical protein
LGALVAGLLAMVPGLVPIQDHRDQWGLTAALGTAYDIASTPGQVGDYKPGFKPLLEIGATLAVTDLGDELALRLRFVDITHIGPQLLFGYRGYFGDEEFKTFFEADVFLTSAPFWGGGVHGGLGAQYDFNRTWGLFLEAGYGVSFGASVFNAFDAQLGGQVRF